MIEVAIMIEGQNGLNWPRWQKMVAAVEELGFAGLFRSDHYTNSSPPDKDSLELWVSLTWLASHTERIEFGPLVSPVSFRHPTMTARMASAVDDLSGGRLILGMGAGWQEREHTNYGWDLLELSDRFDRFEEGLEVVSQLLHSDEPVDFAGKYYQLKEGIVLPRPHRPGGPPILVGGNGPKRTLPLTAKYAQEWNALPSPPETVAKLNQRLTMLLEQEGRDPTAVRRSMMTGLAFTQDQQTLDARLSERGVTAEALRERGIIVGVKDEIVPQLEALSEAGLERVMLQWMDLDDLEGLAALAEVVV